MLPLSRDQSFAIGVDVAPETMNNIQDQIIAMHLQGRIDRAAYEYNQPWHAAALPADWATSVILGSPTSSIAVPTASAPWRHLAMVLPASSSMKAYGLSFTHLRNDIAVVIDTAVMLSITSGTPELEFGVEVSTEERLAIQCHSNSTALLLVTDGSDTEIAGSWIPNDVNHLRLMVEGSTFTGLSAGTCRARAWVNGVASSTITFSSVPAANPVRMYIAGTSVSGTSGTLRVGAARARWYSPGQF